MFIITCQDPFNSLIELNSTSKLDIIPINQDLINLNYIPIFLKKRHKKEARKIKIFELKAVYLKLILAAFFLGSTFISGKILSQIFPPLTCAFLRFSVAAFFLFVFIYRKNGTIPLCSFRNLIVIFLLSLIGIAGDNFLFFSGLRIIQANRGAIIIALGPISILVFSSIIFKEKLTKYRLFGIFLSVIGAIIVISKGDFNKVFQGNIGMGELYMLGSVFSWTFFTLLGKRIMEMISPVVVLAYAGLMAAFILLYPVILEGQIYLLFQWNTTIILSVLALGLLGTALAYNWYYEGIKKIGPSRSGAFINLVPIFAAVLSTIIFKEEVTRSFVIGAILVFVGVYITNRIKPQKI